VRKRILRSFKFILLVVVFSASVFSATAQPVNTTRYVYDDNGRLHAVISSTGDAVVYEYDAAGNITAIRRLPANMLAILSFSPHEGLSGDEVTFIGVGFGGGVTNVSFNGASASIVSVTASTVVAIVPAGATTGLVTLNTPTGSVTTATPFTIAGLRITPSAATIKFGESVQFAAEVLPSTLDQAVVWSVDNVIGGNASVGTISPAGLYTAPNTTFSSLVIRAAGVADNARFGEAQVTVNDPDDIQSVFAAAVSVQRGENVNTSALARNVAVQYGALGEPQSGLSRPLAVQFGNLAESGAALARALTVQYGNAAAQASALANSVSVQVNDGPLQYFPLNHLSATFGPYIQSISPGSFNRATATSATITGAGLTGTTALRFINASGAIDTTITVSNISVSADGSSLTATITVPSGALVGSRVVVIVMPNGDSIGVDLTVNRINIQ
jgi:YD repeat-containing protein